MYDGMYYDDDFTPYFGPFELPEEQKNAWIKVATHQRTKNFQKKLPKYKRKLRKANKKLVKAKRKLEETEPDSPLFLLLYSRYIWRRYKADKYSDLVNLGKYHIKPGSDNPFEKYEFPRQKFQR